MESASIPFFPYAFPSVEFTQLWAPAKCRTRKHDCATLKTLVANLAFQFPHAQRGEDQPASSFQSARGGRSQCRFLCGGGGTLRRSVVTLFGFLGGDSLFSFPIASGWLEMGHDTMTAFSISRA